jgi:hypothetical protein
MRPFLISGTDSTPFLVSYDYMQVVELFKKFFTENNVICEVKTCVIAIN